MDAIKEAKKLVKDMMLYSYNKTKRGGFIHYEVSHKIDKELAKECALIAVDEMLRVTPMYVGNLNETWKFLNEVKQEIKKL